MKRFLQYLSESRRVLSEDMPIVTGQGERPDGFQYSTTSSMPEHLGNIGPYQVHHFEEHPDVGGEAIVVHHEGKQVGVFPIFNAGRRSGRNIVGVDVPNIHPAHRGKKAKVRGLASKVYAMIADKFGGVISGHKQTPGSQSLWRNLAKMRKATLVSDTKRKSVSSYGHAEHPRLKMSTSNVEDYRYYHSNASELNPRANRHQRSLDMMRTRLIGAGADRRKVGRMKKLADFPAPRSFKRTSKKIPTIKTYNPDNPEHVSVAYGPETGNDMRLLVMGNKKKK